MKMQQRSPKTKLYGVWHNMKERCNNPKSEAFKNYGGRGIKVCDEWLNDFQTFYNWAIDNGYRESLTLDRIDNDGDYRPSNCKWSTRKEQSNNRRSNIYVMVNGEKMTIKQCAEIGLINNYTNFIHIRNRRIRGVKRRSEYLREQEEQTNKKKDVLRKELEINPNLSIRELARKTGISKSAVQRLRVQL